MQAAILAGGLGTRLAPYTSVLPKPLMPVGGAPILELILLQLRRHGCTQVTLCVGHLARLIASYFGDGRRYGLHISYSLETGPLGTAGPLSLVTPLNEPLLVMNADLLSTLDYGAMIRFHEASSAALTVGLYPKHVKIDLGVLKLDPTDRRVVAYEEKPEYEYQVSMGIYVVSPSVHRSIHRRERLDFPDLVRETIAGGEKVVGYPFRGYWLDIGRLADFERASAEVEEQCGQVLAEARGLSAARPATHASSLPPRSRESLVDVLQSPA